MHQPGTHPALVPARERDLKEGGRYQLEGNAGGAVTRCDPPHGFDATWEMGGDMSWIELRLADQGDGWTLFRLDHIAHVDDERWAQFGPGAVGVGWDSGLIGLYLHLTTRQGVDPAKVGEWSASEEGHRFLTASSDAWYEVSVAFGTDSAAARAAANRTTAFYAGTPEPGAGADQRGRRPRAPAVLERGAGSATGKPCDHPVDAFTH